MGSVAIVVHGVVVVVIKVPAVVIAGGGVVPHVVPEVGVGVVHTGVDNGDDDSLAFITKGPCVVGVDLGNAPGKTLTPLFRVKGSGVHRLYEPGVLVGGPLHVPDIGPGGHAPDGGGGSFAVNAVGKPEGPDVDGVQGGKLLEHSALGRLGHLLHGLHGEFLPLGPVHSVGGSIHPVPVHLAVGQYEHRDEVCVGGAGKHHLQIRADGSRGGQGDRCEQNQQLFHVSPLILRGAVVRFSYFLLLQYGFPPASAGAYAEINGS